MSISNIKMFRIIISAILLKTISCQECVPEGSQCISQCSESPSVLVACCPGYVCLESSVLLGHTGYCVDTLNTASPGECARPGQKCEDYDSNDGVNYEVRGDF